MTLTELSYQSRILGKILAIVFGISLLFYFMILLLINSLKKPLRQEAVIKTSFGKIEKPFFNDAQLPKELMFELDTTSGELPQTTSSASVFFVPDRQTTLLYLNKIDTIAQNFGFDTQTTKYQLLEDANWVKYEDELRELTINIKFFHFKFRLKPNSILQQLVEVKPEERFTNLENQFIETARVKLQENDAYPAELASGKTNITYMRYELGTSSFVPVGPGEIPAAVRIDFYRKGEGDISTVSPQYFTTQNYVLLAPLGRQQEVVEAQFIHFDKLNDEPGVYPLLTNTQAWELLKTNKATIISSAVPAVEKIRIKDMFLAYYDISSYQRYFQPVFIFLGDNKYVGYVPAVSPEYILNATESASSSL